MDTAQRLPLEQVNQAFRPSYELLREDSEAQVSGQPASSVINVHYYGPPPKDFFVWSLFNTIYMNVCCLGIAALAFSVKARDRKVMGDLSGARSYGSTAMCLNIFALVLSLLLFAVVIALVATGVIALQQLARMSLSD